MGHRRDRVLADWTARRVWFGLWRPFRWIEPAIALGHCRCAAGGKIAGDGPLLWLRWLWRDFFSDAVLWWYERIVAGWCGRVGDTAALRGFTYAGGRRHERLSGCGGACAGNGHPYCIRNDA